MVSWHRSLSSSVRLRGGGVVAIGPYRHFRGTAQMCASCLAACSKWAKANGDSTSNAVEFQWPSTMVVGGADYGNPKSLGLAMDLKMTGNDFIASMRV